MERNNVMPKSGKLILPNLTSDIQMNTKGKGNWFIDQYGNQWFRDDQGNWSCFMGWEVDVTPGGSDISDSQDAWDDYYHNYDNQSDYDDYGGPSGGSDNPSNDTQNDHYEKGLKVVEEVANDLSNKAFHVVESISHSDGYKFATTASNSIVLTENMVNGLFNALKANDEFLIKIGKAVGKYAVPASAIQTIVGMTDGEISDADWLSAASTAVGIIGLVATGPIALGTIGVISIGLGVASFFAEGDSESSGSSQY